MPNQFREIETPLRAVDLFPDLHEEIDRRILHSETRIKNWVVTGIMVNLVALIGLGAPLVYYLGAMQAQASAAMATLVKTQSDVNSIQAWKNERERWEDSMEVWAESQGYHPRTNRKEPPQ